MVHFGKKISIAFALGAASLSGSAGAQVLLGDTTGGATWNRPINSGPQISLQGAAVPYQVTSFTVDTDGSYLFTNTVLTARYDNYSFIYVNSFDPGAQLVNLLVGNDDFPNPQISGFNQALTSGTSYFFVASGFDNNDFGQYSLVVSGQGTATFNNIAAVPEPATWAMMLVGFGGMGVVLRRRRKPTTTPQVA